MKKINLKSILKKTFKKKSNKISKKKSKKIIKKKPKKIKKTLKPNKIKKILVKKTLKKNEKTVENQTDNLRISKSNEIKPEIKKVKKQETEKREYKIKDYVVYPKHGVGQITEFKKLISVELM